MAGLVGCGGEGPPVEEPPKVVEAACEGRFVERLDDGGCAAVEVLSIRHEAVVFERDGYPLHGVLTLPETAGQRRAPAVVLVHGSGPHGTSGTLEGSLGVPFDAPVAVYTSLAEQLAWRGVAVLRYEKRSCFAEVVPECSQSVADYPASPHSIVVDDFVEDARAAARHAASRPEIRPFDVIVAGHSQGGSFVPHLVASEAVVSGGIGLAAPALPLVETLPGQIEVFAEHLEALDATLYASTIEELRATAAQFREELPAVLDGTHPEPTYLGASLAFWQSFAHWTDRPASDLALVDEPLLYVSGDLDFNVWPEHLAQYAAWGGATLETELFAGVTHAFVPVVSGIPPIDHVIEPTFSVAVVDRIEGWLRDTETSD